MIKGIALTGLFTLHQQVEALRQSTLNEIFIFIRKKTTTTFYNPLHFNSNAMRKNDTNTAETSMSNRTVHPDDSLLKHIFTSNQSETISIFPQN